MDIETTRTREEILAGAEAVEKEMPDTEVCVKCARMEALRVFPNEELEVFRRVLCAVIGADRWLLKELKDAGPMSMLLAPMAQGVHMAMHQEEGIRDHVRFVMEERGKLAAEDDWSEWEEKDAGDDLPDGDAVQGGENDEVAAGAQARGVADQADPDGGRRSVPESDDRT